MRTHLAYALSLLLLAGCSLPGAASPPPVTTSGSGTSNSPPFSLAAGNYRVDWTLTDTEASTLQCGHGARLASATDQRSYPLGGGNMPRGEQTTSGETYVYNVPAGSYYLAVLANCDWSFTLTPQP